MPINNKLAVGSLSLGRHDSHTLPQKISACVQNGIQGIEITYPDLQLHASALSSSLEDAARDVKKICAENNIYILSFAAFENYEGNPTPLETRLNKARQWLNLARLMGAEHLQVPSSFDRSFSTDRKVIISELRALADLAASEQPVIKIAYENLGWSTHCWLWQQALSIAQEVDRDNFGLCLDSFHEAVALWADPFNETGIQEQGEAKLARTLQELAKDLPLDKLFYLQLSDGEPMPNRPYSKDHPWYDASLEPGHVWSNEARPFPLEKAYGAYMPVEQITKAFLQDLGYKGWVSLETFDRRMRKEQEVPAKNAKRAAESWVLLKRQLSKGQANL